MPTAHPATCTSVITTRPVVEDPVFVSPLQLQGDYSTASPAVKRLLTRCKKSNDAMVAHRFGEGRPHYAPFKTVRTLADLDITQPKVFRKLIGRG